MNRTFGALLITLSLGLIVTPLAGEAPPAGKVARIGLLAGHSQNPREQHAYEAFNRACVT
jgi:hypothetical protein